MRASVKVWQLLVAMAMTFVLAAVGTAIATIPDGDGVIHGCYKKAGNNKGMVRVIDSAVTSNCPTGYATLNWNQQGVPGVTNVVPVYAKVATVSTPSNELGNPLAYCDPGDQVISGGFYHGAPDFFGVNLLWSYPQMPEDGWQISAFNGTGDSVDISASVVCLDTAAPTHQ